MLPASVQMRRPVADTPWVTSVLRRASERERLRLSALHEYGIVDAPSDDELDAVMRVAATVAGVPTATLNLIDENRQCQLTTVGFEGGDSARSDSMCAVQFESGTFVHVRDATLDPRYAANPWVTGLLADVRFYASFPLVTARGHALGTLCVFDSEPGELNEEQIARLHDCADIILALFERRREARRSAAAAAEAERREQFTKAVLETIDVGVIAADGGGHLVMFNRTAREWHGLDPDPSLEPSQHADMYALYEVDGTTRLAPHRVPLHRAFTEGAVTGAEFVIAPAGSRPRLIKANSRALTTHDGAVIGAVVAMSDVTAERAQQQAIERAHAALAERGTQLVATVAELERSNAELAHFAGAVSHDLLSPLGVVGGYLELLDEVDDVPSRARTWIGTAASAVTRMKHLIQALLSYAQAGNASLRLQPTDLREVLGQALTDLRGQLRDANADVVVGSDLPTVTCDPTLIRQLLQNLVGNAIKYRDPQRPCRIVVAATGRQNVTVAVADNGIGIPAEQRRRVFEAFAQLDPHRAGHGIGLSTCARIVDRHGGRIWADETAGGGTTIRFTLQHLD